MFRKVLIANRGEIARRVLRTCHRLGIATVAVYSDADDAAPHAREADEAVRLGPAPAAASYLSIERVVDAALRTGADAVHPGYGFLAENPALAEACEAKGLTFVGPAPETIRLMADKAAAKRHLEAAGIPVIPWASTEELDDGGALAVGQRVGYPALVKAVAGGGGVGMRRVERPRDLLEALAAARMEARAAFGDPRVLLEALVPRARHVEFQVFGDGRGAAVHLFERECSVQRRHQKIVEECPSPALDEPLRRRMADAAVAAARSVAYRGAGTVEMLLSEATGDFHFLEMNTRLQVEHPVTELVTGLDLVEWQLRIAAGGGLPLGQDAIPRQGHALEVRVYAEDPARDHLPQTGQVLVLDIPDGPGVRVDAGVTTGSVVGTHYDPLIGKVVVHAATRAEAIRRMAWLLRHTAVLGVTTNVDHLVDVVSHPAFVAGTLTTAFLEEHLADWHPPPTSGEALAAAAAALLASSGGRGGSGPQRGPGDPWHTLGPWRVAGVGGWRLRLRDRDGVDHDLVVGGRPHHFRLEVAGACHEVRVAGAPHPEATVALEVDGRQVHARVAVTGAGRGGLDEGEAVWVHTPGATTRLAVVRPTRQPGPSAAEAATAARSPLPGTVAAVHVAHGDHVAASAVLVVVEAMKMQHPVRAPSSGTVTAVHVAVGDAVDVDQALVELRPADEDDDAGRSRAGPAGAPGPGRAGPGGAPGRGMDEDPRAPGGAAEGGPHAPGRAPPDG